MPTSCDQSNDNDTKLKKSQRYRATVASMSSLPTSCDSSSTPTVFCTGFRRDYELGETLRSPSHMIAQPTFEENMKPNEEGERMTFVPNNDASTKVIRRRKILERSWFAYNMNVECNLYVCNYSMNQVTRGMNERRRIISSKMDDSDQEAVHIIVRSENYYGPALTYKQ